MDENSSIKNLQTASASCSSLSSDKFNSVDQGDESSDENLPIPKSLIGAENYLTLTEGNPCALTVEELTEAVSKCKDLILDSDVCSDERKWLVRRLIELRYQLLTVNDSQAQAPDSEPISSRIIVGHHLKIRYEPTSTTKRYCDTCCGSIWNVVQYWYQCVDCRYRCHTKCVDHIVRPCAHLTASDKPYYENNICPEIGLAAQNYKCFECKQSISLQSSWVAARLCDYTGMYYCTSCHWNNALVVPARVAHNWDFTPHYVCRSTYLLLRFTRHRPLIMLQPRLYGFVKELAEIKRLREVIALMKPYLVRCREAKSEKKLLWKQFGTRSHLLEPSEVFSLQDLTDLNSGKLLEVINEAANKFSDHITKLCLICRGHGYTCELCDDKDDVVFPFYSSAYVCPASTCNWVYHKNCWLRSPICQKCERNEKRKQETIQPLEL